MSDRASRKEILARGGEIKENYLSKRSLIIAVALTAGIFVGSVGWYLNTSDGDIEPESKAEIYNFIKDNYVSQTQYGDIRTAIRELDAEHHEAIDELEDKAMTAIQDIRNDIQQLKLDVALLKAGTDGDEIRSTSNFDLRLCEDFNCTDQTSRFSQGDIIYLRGDHSTGDRMLEYEIRDSDNIRIDSGQASLTQGNFIWIWTIPDNLDDGSYTILIEIDRNEDEIDFRVS